MNPAPYGNLIELAIEPKAGSFQTVEVALAKLADGDALLTIAADSDEGLIILGGISEMHLDNVISRLKLEIGDVFRVGAPQVAYREMLAGAATIEHTHKRQVGGIGEFARVVLQFEPAKQDCEFVFENAAGDALPEKFVKAVKTSLEQCRQTGLLVGFPLVQFRATLINGAHHEIDSTEKLFEPATRAAFRKLRKHGYIILAEPIMRLEIISPEDVVGSIIGDLHARRGAVLAQRKKTGAVFIEAEAPLGQLFGYQNTLRAISEGQGRWSMAFDRYERVPRTPDDDDPQFPAAAAMRA